MGQQTSKQNITYSVPITQPKQGESAIYRHPLTVKELIKSPPSESLKNINTLQDQFLQAVERYPNNKFLGTINHDAKGYTSKNYQQIKEIATQFGSGLLNNNLCPVKNEYKNYNFQMIGIFSKNREEWLITDIASTLYKLVVVSLYDTLGPESISHCLHNSGIETCICSKLPLDILLKETSNLQKLKNIIALDPLTEEQGKLLKEKNLKVFSYNEIIEFGKQNIIPIVQIKDSDCFTFSYTSGTTGLPKATMITHRNLVASCASADLTTFQIDQNDIHLSYLPLPHVFERFFSWQMLKYGAQIVFYRGDTLLLKDDLQIVKPTVFISVPRLYNRFYTKIKSGIEESSIIKKTIANNAIEKKLQNFREKAQLSHALYDKIVFNKTAAALGGRVRLMLSGSAPLQPEVKEFMSIAMCAPLFEGYGQTETTTASSITTREDQTLGHVGGVIGVLEFKVIDVPEMNYLTTNKNEQGELTPRGELCFRGYNVFEGYYKDEEKTKEVLDDDGWLYTGDIGQVLPNGAIKIIDRKKNIFKLSQGEYVAPEKIEQVYSKTEMVEQIYLHGESLQNHCITIVSPNQNYIKKLASENQINGTYEELCKNLKIRELCLNLLQKLGQNAGLKGFEQAQNIYLLPQSMMDLGLITSTMKLQRFKAKEHFKAIILELYQEGIMNLKQ